MLKHLFLSASMCAFVYASAQKKMEQSRWQQRVEYTIAVSLDDVNNVLSGSEQMVYTNNSPDMLKEMYIHLWPNAYKNRETAFARQVLENGSDRFHFAEESQRGWIDSLDFKINGTSVKWELTKDIDIAHVTLSEPIAPGASVTITTPFRVKMPYVFSRLGREGQLYCVTQWYPKPAVYDVNGWNPMPYLDQGEFYSEFGKFDVQITIPENYVVAATGELQDEKEKQWLLSKTQYDHESKDRSFPESSSRKKTIRFVQDSIHDFAWFADKRFKVDTGSVVLPRSGRRVQTWFYHVRATDKAIDDIDTAITFYSDKLGDYPYNHVSVVVTPLVAGAGMEYPMITNMTEADKQVVIHEVGHNWFYGILGSNEREYPWMDESINNYYETRCSENEELKEPVSIKGFGQLGGLNRAGYPGLILRYMSGARLNEDQASDLPSVAFTDHNYGAIIYGKASASFHYLQRYLGDSLFDEMMRAYYEAWKFRHPLPGDFKKHVQQFTGKELSWFFNDVMGTTRKQDWKLSGLRETQQGYELKVRNKGSFEAPLSITGMSGNTPVTTVWYDSTGSGNIVFPKGPYDRIRVDAYELTADMDRTNNTMRTSGLLRKCEPLQFRLLGDVENPYRKQLFFTPIIGANLYNKTMLGAAFYNSLYPTTKTEYVIAPMYAFGTEDLAGSAEIQRHFLSYGFARRITLGFRTSRFASEYFVPTTYEKLEPSIRIELTRPDMRTSADKTILARYVLINEQARGAGYYTNIDQAFGYADVSFSVVKKRVINPYSAKFMYQLGNARSTFQKISAEGTHFITYNKPAKGFTIRAYGGMFLQKPGSGDDRVLFRTSGNTGQFDYLFDQSQFGRGENMFSNSLFAQQLMQGGAQFSVPYPMLGSTDSWITAINLNTTIPGIIPVKLYADVVYVNELHNEVNGNTGAVTKSYSPELYYTGGIRISMFKQLLQVNFPLFASGQIQDMWDGKNGGAGVKYAERISFTLDLNRMNPIKAIREISF
jgi:hypothetical protein